MTLKEQKDMARKAFYNEEANLNEAMGLYHDDYCQGYEVKLFGTATKSNYEKGVVRIQDMIKKNVNYRITDKQLKLLQKKQKDDCFNELKDKDLTLLNKRQASQLISQIMDVEYCIYHTLSFGALEGAETTYNRVLDYIFSHLTTNV